VGWDEHDEGVRIDLVDLRLLMLQRIYLVLYLYVYHLRRHNGSIYLTCDATTDLSIYLTCDATTDLSISLTCDATTDLSIFLSVCLFIYTDAPGESGEGEGGLEAEGVGA
jgi:hypothetical protein